jgi:hypothetical protein
VKKEEVKGRGRITRRNRTKEVTSKKKMKNGRKKERESEIGQLSKRVHSQCEKFSEIRPRNVCYDKFKREFFCNIYDTKILKGTRR